MEFSQVYTEAGLIQNFADQVKPVLERTAVALRLRLVGDVHASVLTSPNKKEATLVIQVDVKVNEGVWG